MRQFTVENQGIQTFLVYALKDDDIIDEVHYDMIHDNQILGILPTFLSSADGRRCLKFNISSRISLEQFFHGVMNRTGFLSAFYSIVSTLKASGDYMLNCGYFLLDSRYIYVNVGTKEAELISIPIIEEKETPDLKIFLKDIVFQTQFDPSENASYVVKIIKYLDGGSAFSIAGLQEMLEKIIEEDESGIPFLQKDHFRIHTMNFTHTAQPEPAQADWEGPVLDTYKEDHMEFAETSVLSSNMLRKEEVTVPKESSDVTAGSTDKKKGKRTILNLFAGKWNKKQDSQEEMTEAEENKPASLPVKPAAVMSEDVSESAAGQVFFAQAYLKRIKTQEHIRLDKQVFKIGKERSFVDYCINDNQTISRSHANIVMEKDEYYIMDMNSKNHTYVNGRMIHSGDRVKLIPGSHIRLSNEEFEFYLQS